MQDNLLDDCLKWAAHVRDGRFADVDAFVRRQADFDRRGLRMFSNESHGWGRAFDNETHPFLLRRMRSEHDVAALVSHFESRQTHVSEVWLAADASRWLDFHRRSYQANQEMFQYYLHPLSDESDIGSERVPMRGCTTKGECLTLTLTLTNMTYPPKNE